MQKIFDLIVVGAGPSGIMAALRASMISRESKIAIIERNKEIGKKLKITGGGRCNLTSNIDILNFKDYILRNPKFLYKSFKNFTNTDLINFFEDEKVKFYNEGNKIYPISDKATEIIDVLYKKIKDNNITLILNEKMLDFDEYEDYIHIYTEKYKLKSHKMILATGGESFKNTGSDGYVTKLLNKKGINICNSKPSLVKIDLKNNIKNISGISLEKVKISVFEYEKILYKDEGDIVFTSTGISGPLAIKSSSYISGRNLENIKIKLDMLPDIEVENIIEILKNNNQKNIISKLSKFLPKNLLKEIFDDCINIDFNNIKKSNLIEIINRIKKNEFQIEKLGDLEYATITRGGIDIKEINPSTMELKKLKNVYVAGEMIDVDGLTGGYNLQIAFSTGYLAGENALQK